MSRLDIPQPIEVDIGPCDCPKQPHDRDLVYLAPALSMSGGMAAQGVIQQAGSDVVRLQELLADIWIRHGVIDWNLVDEDGDKVDLTPDTIARALPYGKGGRLVAERADDLYAEDILAPLAERLKTLSQGGRSGRSTSRTRKSRSKRPSPSSTATTEEAPPSA